MTSPSALVNSASLFWSLISGTTCKEISGSLSTSLYLCLYYHFGVRDFPRGEGRECLFWIIALWLHFTKGGGRALLNKHSLWLIYLALVTLGPQFWACSKLFFNTSQLSVEVLLRNQSTVSGRVLLRNQSIVSERALWIPSQLSVEQCCEEPVNCQWRSVVEKPVNCQWKTVVEEPVHCQWKSLVEEPVNCQWRSVVE